VDEGARLVTELAESGAGDEVIMSIAGHVSRAMLSRYSHVRMEAKRGALDEIAGRQRRSQRWWMPAERFKADRRRPNNLQSNTKQPPVTSNHSVPGSGVDVGAESEGAKTLPETVGPGSSKV
jgi:hypothetical protein